MPRFLIVPLIVLAPFTAACDDDTATVTGDDVGVDEWDGLLAAILPAPIGVQERASRDSPNAARR